MLNNAKTSITLRFKTRNNLKIMVICLEQVHWMTVGNI